MTKVFAQIRASVNIKERVKPETTLVQIPNMLQMYWMFKHRVEIRKLQKIILQYHAQDMYGEGIKIKILRNIY